MGRGQQQVWLENGASLEFPPYSGLTGARLNLTAIPDVYLAAHATQLYPVGTVYREGLRTFVYGKWSSTTSLKTAGYGVCTVATFKDLSSKVISGNSGESTIKINFDATACAVNAYAGGFLGIKGSVYRSCYIISNKVKDGTNYVEFTVDGTWPNNLLTTDKVVLMENPYAEMRWYITEDTRPYIGVTTNTIVVSRYTWIQTWGPHMQCAVFNSFEGDTGNQFGVFFYHGSFQTPPTNTDAIVHSSLLPGCVQQAGVFACGSDPSSPADISIAYPVFITIRP